MRIIQERYRHSEFAFLSVWYTAVRFEVLDLVAGMQFAGFNGVIGTLWTQPRTRWSLDCTGRRSDSR